MPLFIFTPLLLSQSYIYAVTVAKTGVSDYKKAFDYNWLIFLLNLAVSIFFSLRYPETYNFARINI